MIDKYILFGSALGIGGWQIYNEGRVAYLLKKKYSVTVVSSKSKGNRIKLEYFNKVQVLENDYIYHIPFIYTSKIVTEIVDDILREINYKEGEKLFIEATTVNSSYWAEIIAQRTKGIAFSYLLHSHIDYLNDSEIDFFKFKHKQKLLAGMTSITLKDVFKDKVKLKEEEYYAFRANGRDPLTSEIVEDKIILALNEKKREGKKIIGYFGTLNKSHIYELSNRILEFCHNYAKQDFVYITIGSSQSLVAEKYITNLFSSIKNAEYFPIEEMYPVPELYFSLMDVCIGSWGSARTAARTGVKTIRLLGDTDVVAQGIIGITLRNGKYYDLPCGSESLEEYLEQILFSDMYEAVDNNSLTEYSDYEINQIKLNDFLHEYLYEQPVIEYYPVMSIKKDKKTSMIRIANIVLGYKRIEAIRNRIKSIRNWKDSMKKRIVKK